MDRFDVAAVYCDPFHWRSETDAWARQYGPDKVLSYPTNSVTRFGPAVDRFRAAIAAGTISHDGDPDLTRHILNARLVRGRGRADDDGHALYLLEKPGANRLIDAAVAAVLAVEAMARVEPVAPEAEIMVAFG
jgi:phage terminase large subunit-like protein